MKIINKDLESFGRLLHSLLLNGKDSRMRTRLLKVIDTHLREVVAEETNQLIDQYAIKDDEGELVLVGENQFKLVEETSHLYHKEISELMNEHMHIEENDTNKDMLLSVASFILEGDFEVSGDMALQYDEWCDEFEKVIENYTLKVDPK